MSETSKPHTAVMSIQLEVHSLLDTGECSGRVVNEQKLKDHGIEPAFLTTISGYTLEDCLEKLKVWIEGAKDEHV